MHDFTILDPFKEMMPHGAQCKKGACKCCVTPTLDHSIVEKA